MSDTMLLGVLLMPRELREADELSKMQFDARVLEAAELIEELKAKVQRLREEDQANGELYKVLSQRMDSIEKHRDELFDENKRLREAIVSAPHSRWCPWPKSGTKERCICWKSKALEDK